MTKNMNLTYTIYIILTLMGFHKDLYSQGSYYWIGGSGNWDDPNHWSKNSGGSPVGGIPDANINAIFNNNSGLINGSTVTIPPGTFAVNNFSVQTSAQFELLLNSSTNNSVAIEVNGNLTFTNGLTVTYGVNSRFFNVWKFLGGNTHTIQPSGKDLLNVEFMTASDVYNLSGPLIASLQIRMHGGTWNSNNHNITTAYLLFRDSNGSSNPIPKLFNAGTSNIFCDEWYSQLTYGSLEVTGNHIIHTKVFSGSAGTLLNNFSYHEIHLLEYQDNPPSGVPQIEHNNFECSNCEIENLIIEDTGDTRLAGKFTVNGILEVVNQGSTIKFNGGNGRLDEVVLNGTVVTPASGTCQERTIFTNDFNDFTTIIRNSGTLTIPHAIIEDISTSGGATFQASNGLLLGASTGWNEINPPVAKNYTWLGTISTNWENPGNWLEAGGGTNTCIPTKFDNVLVSPASSGQIIISNGVTAECRNFIWTKTSPDSLTLNGITNSYSKLLITGNIQLHSSAKIKATEEYDEILLNSFGIRTINTGLVKLPRVRFKSQAGEWHLLSKFDPAELLFEAGTLDTKGKQITTSYWSSVGSQPKNYILSASKIGVNGEFKVSDLFNYGSVTLNAGTSSISCKKLTSTITNFYNVSFLNTVPITLDNYAYNFNKLSLSTAHQVSAINTLTVNDLVFGVSGSSLAIDNVDGLVINGGIQSNASAMNPGILKSDLAGTRAEISKAAGNICVTGHVGFQDIVAEMTGVFNAPFGHDNGNNENINYDNGMGSTSLFWIGQSGEWHESNKWSRVSGGCPTGNIPNASTNVVFDNYSVISNQDTVTIATSASCGPLNVNSLNYYVNFKILDEFSPGNITVDGTTFFIGEDLISTGDIVINGALISKLRNFTTKNFTQNAGLVLVRQPTNGIATFNCDLATINGNFYVDWGTLSPLRYNILNFKELLTGSEAEMSVGFHNTVNVKP